MSWNIKEIMNALLESNSKGQIPSWEANRSSASQEILRILWKPKVHYRIHKHPPTCPYPEPNHFSPCSPCHFLETRFNIILPSTIGLPSGLFPSGLPTKTLYTALLFLKTQVSNLRANNREVSRQKCYPLWTFRTILVITLNELDVIMGRCGWTTHTCTAFVSFAA